MDQKKRTEIASLGQFGLIDLLTSGFTPKNASTLKGAGDDAAVIAPGRGEAVLCTTDSFYEGVDFDLTYFPLKHLGYKAVTAGVSDILAMNALPAQITVSLGVSSKLPVEALQDLYEGIAFACKEQEIDLVGGDTRAARSYAGADGGDVRRGAADGDLAPGAGLAGYAVYLDCAVEYLGHLQLEQAAHQAGVRPGYQQLHAAGGAAHFHDVHTRALTLGKLLTGYLLPAREHGLGGLAALA